VSDRSNAREVPEASVDSDSPAPTSGIIDAHVHFWDPAALTYPWLSTVPRLQQSFLPREYRGFCVGPERVPVDRLVFVEANPSAAQNLDEVELVSRLAEAKRDPRIAAIVAYVDLTDRRRRDASLEALTGNPLVRGIRHNIQGNPSGFCLQTEFVEGVRDAGRRGLRFDLCATHDQLDEVVELVRRNPDTHFVLDHCGKPAVRAALLDPWRAHIDALASFDNVFCKLSGLLTEADPERWREEDLLPYASHVVDRFGTDRVMYGSDWPVCTLAGRSSDWYPFTRRFTEGWSETERSRFYRDNAIEFYGL
jgi:L-fuconolactonase